MFTPKHTTVKKTRHEFFVPNKATKKDVFDAMFKVEKALEEVKGGSGAADWDNAYHVRADDEGIVFYFDVKEKD